MSAPVLPRMTPDEVRSVIDTQLADFLVQARSRPTVELYDCNWENSVPIFGEESAKWLEKMNDTGEGNLILFGSNEQRQWIIDELGEWEDLHVRVRHGFKEWTGKASEIEYESDAEGFEYINIKFLHEFEHAKKIICFCNPFFPAELQYPKIWALAAPSVFALATTTFLNLLRRFALPWTFSDNLFDPASWRANFNPAEWPIVVVPKPFLTDTSMWTTMATRMGNLYDVSLPTLKQAGIHMKVYRWFPGMPQPAPDHFTLTKSTLVIDFIDKSGWVGPTGTLVDGVLSLVSEVADDFINEVAKEVTYTESPEYSIAGWLGTTRENPWVLWRSAQSTNGISGVERWKMVRHKATASSIVTGGKSPDYINAGLKLLFNGVLGYLGQLIGNPGLALGVFDGQVENVILAFHRSPNPVRISKMGPNGPPYGEAWESSGGTGFSPSALQSIRTGFYRSAAYTTFEVKCRAGAPYWPGAHFDVGDRNVAEIGNTGNLYTEHVTSMGFGWTRDSDVDYDIGLGDGQVQDTPGAILSRQIAMVREMVQAVGVSS